MQNGKKWGKCQMSTEYVRSRAMEEEGLQTLQPEDREWWCGCDVGWQFIP